MPLLKAEDVVSFVISDARVQEHLRHAEQQRSRQSFRDFVARFGIYDFGQLTESQVFAFVAARNTASLIDLLQIPRGNDAAGGQAHAAYDIHRKKTSLGPSIQAFLGAPPAMDQEYEVLRDPEDIPEAIPEDLLLRRLAPKEFLRRLTEGELLRSAWVQEDFDDAYQAPNEVDDQAVRPQDRANKVDARPFGYLLLDASESMGSGRDHRNEVARGIALAFLLSQYEAGNPTVIHLFRHELSPLIGGEGRAAFEAAVAAVLSHSHEGMTSLQGALKLLADTMRHDHARVDIVLITDGVTRLLENPVDDAHLHTFLVGVRPEEFDKFGASQYQDSLIQLRNWSDFMFRLDPDIMLQGSIPRRDDVLDAANAMYGFGDEWNHSASPEKIRRLQGRLKIIRSIFLRYRKANSRTDAELDRAFEMIESAVHNFGVADPLSVATTHATQWVPIDRELSIALEAKELRPLNEPPNLGASWKIEITMPTYVSPWEWLRTVGNHIKRGTIRFAKRVARKLGIRRNRKNR